VTKEDRLSPARLLSIGLIYAFTAVAWFTLGASLVSRTGQSDQQLSAEVAELWGGRHQQLAPAAWFERERTVSEGLPEKDAQGQVSVRTVTRTVTDRIPLPLSSSRLEVGLQLDHRRKGLLWYDTYAVAFRGQYRVRNTEPVERPVVVRFVFPAAQGLYDGFHLRLNGQEVAPGTDLSQGLEARAVLPAAGEAQLEVAYRSRGLDQWTYSFGAGGVTRVEDFELQLDTDFDRPDFPGGTLSPSRKSRTPSGWRLQWRFDSLVTGQGIGVDLPNRLNPGPLASRITFFAPVGLLFFFTVMVILGAVRGDELHPMNYFFLAAAFFAFHLLLAYLVDHLDIHASFLAASAASVFLVISYLRLVCGMRYALVRAGGAQLVFLVLFSYAFFFEGFTGLAVTVGAVITLFALMQLTARVDWNAVFARGRGARA
jgi:hypothetical protein